jgi:hypothetical protein
VFVGGCATGLLITDPATGSIRPTMDVDVITEVASYAEYASLSDRLRGLGLGEDSREGAPTCRWRYRDLIIDVMPTDERVLGFSNRWYAPAIAAAQRITVADLNIRVVTAVRSVTQAGFPAVSKMCPRLRLNPEEWGRCQRTDSLRQAVGTQTLRAISHAPSLI